MRLKASVAQASGFLSRGEQCEDEQFPLPHAVTASVDGLEYV